MGLMAAPDWRSDPEGVHQVRVASRRVRSVLALVRPELYPGFKRQSRRLRLLTRALGLTREMDVHALYLEELAGKVPGLATGSALEHALELLERGRTKARKAMEEDLEGNPVKHLPDLLKVPSLPDPFAPGDLASDAWQALDPLLDASFSPIPGLLVREDPPALHAVRIRVKNLRYALEVLADAFPAPPEALLRQFKELQGALGEHHDRVMLEALLQEQYQGLALRGRRTLASGTLEVLAYVGEARLKAFERFRGVAAGLPLEDVRASLRLGLGLAAADRP